MYPVKPKAGEKRPRITTPFGRKGSSWMAGEHTGTDFGWTRPIEFVRATFLGHVVHVGRGDRYYGNYVVIQHASGRQSWYCHLAFVRPGIKAGHLVHTGRFLGVMGQSGNAFGRHLHYEEREAPYEYMDYVTPRLFTKPRPSRLKGWAS